MQRIAFALLVLAACSDDAPGPDFTFTGGYEDWDSTENSFLGVNAAVVTEVGNPSNTATTAPNGRSTLILPGQTSQVTYTADGYLPARYTVEPSAAVDPYEVRGITETRLATYFDELGETYDPATALVEIEVRDPDVTVTVDGAEGTPWLDAYLVFPNVAVGGGTVSLEVDAGRPCHFPSSLHVAAGELAMTTIDCD